MAQVNFSGTWHNQHDSEMTLQVGADGRVSGKYRTGVGAPRPAEEFDLCGFAKGDQITFTVDFSKYATFTAWVGQVTDQPAPERIETLWHLSENVPDADEPKKMWNSVTTGGDIFMRGPSPKRDLVKLTARPSHPLKAKVK